MSQCNRPFLFILLLVGSILAACSQAPESDWAPGDLVTATINETSVDLELALTHGQRQKGLMHREHLPENQGMLFVFSRPSVRSFWMKNTLIPLDIAYIDPEGKILEIHKLHPHNQNGVRSHSKNIQYALEVNQGWFHANDIKSGDKLDFQPLERILADHGYRTPSK